MDTEKNEDDTIFLPWKLVGNDHKYENGGYPKTHQSLLTSVQ